MASKWRKSPPELIELFYSVLPKEAEQRKMFGYPCAFINRNMFTGLHQENMIIRLDKETREQFMEKYDTTQFEPMKGRIMKEYVCIPDDMFEDEELLAEWVKKSFTYAKSLPPKPVKKKKKKI